MARADTPTLLALDRFAQILGINGAHFNMAQKSNLMPARGSCTDIWMQFSWQEADRVSRDDLAMTINEVESEIAEAIGFWPAPMWISDEMHQFPRHYRRTVIGSGINVRGFHKGFRAKWGKFIQAGQRAVTLIDTATVVGGELVYSDEDGDGLAETATITVTTTVTDICEVKVYFTDENGAQEWEIRPARSKTLAAGVATLVFWAWQFVLPATWDQLTTENDIEAVDFTVAANLAIGVEVYREFTDFTVVSAQLFFENEHLHRIPILCSTCSGTGCPACTLTVQDGCIHVRDVDTGLVVPVAATFDEDAEQWVEQTFADCREPDIVKIFYYAGDLDNRFLRGDTCDPLSNFWAQTIAYMAVARLERPLCACANVTALANKLQRNLAFADTKEGFAVAPADLENPFGTHLGELTAWKRVSKFVRKRGKVAVF